MAGGSSGKTEAHLRSPLERIGGGETNKLAAPDSFKRTSSEGSLPELPPAICLLPPAYCLLLPSVGSPADFHAPMPPRRAAVSSMAFCLSASAAPALVCSAGQVQ